MALQLWRGSGVAGCEEANAGRKLMQYLISDA
jgi:hypothetical protein